MSVEFWAYFHNLMEWLGALTISKLSLGPGGKWLNSHVIELNDDPSILFTILQFYIRGSLTLEGTSNRCQKQCQRIIRSYRDDGVRVWSWSSCMTANQKMNIEASWSFIEWIKPMVVTHCKDHQEACLRCWNSSRWNQHTRHPKRETRIRSH